MSVPSTQNKPGTANASIQSSQSPADGQLAVTGSGGHRPAHKPSMTTKSSTVKLKEIKDEWKTVSDGLRETSKELNILFAEIEFILVELKSILSAINTPDSIMGCIDKGLQITESNRELHGHIAEFGIHLDKVSNKDIEKIPKDSQDQFFQLKSLLKNWNDAKNRSVLSGAAGEKSSARTPVSPSGNRVAQTRSPKSLRNHVPNKKDLPQASHDDHQVGQREMLQRQPVQQQQVQQQPVQQQQVEQQQVEQQQVEQQQVQQQQVQQQQVQQQQVQQQQVQQQQLQQQQPQKPEQAGQVSIERPPIQLGIEVSQPDLPPRGPGDLPRVNDFVEMQGDQNAFLHNEFFLTSPFSSNEQIEAEENSTDDTRIKTAPSINRIESDLSIINSPADPQEEVLEKKDPSTQEVQLVIEKGDSENASNSDSEPPAPVVMTVPLKEDSSNSGESVSPVNLQDKQPL